MFFSAKTRGFYTLEIHGDSIPTDAVEITAEQHQALISGQSDGKTISAGADGYPVLFDPAEPTAEDLAVSVSARREAAYRSESDPLFFKYQRGEVTEQVWLDKVAEIRGRYE